MSQIPMHFGESTDQECPSYLKEQLITYIGNKRSLLGFIEGGIREALRRHPECRNSFADVFAGSGIVSRLARKYFDRLFINDIEKYSFIVNEAYQSNFSNIDWAKYKQELLELRARTECELAPGFITDLYAPRYEANIQKTDRVFYTRRNASYIDTARRLLQDEDFEYQGLFLAGLIQQASVHTNTSGVFKGFYKNQNGVGQFGGHSRNALARIMAPITIPEIVLSRFERSVEVTQYDAAAFVGQLGEVDIAYLDPPYNQHPYGSNYFMLNLIADYNRPTNISQVSGIPKSWNRSPYNKRPEAKDALFQMIENCRAKIILLSYNSEGFIGVDELVEYATELGDVTTFDERYNTFRGCRNLRERAPHVTEHLLMIERH